MTVKNGQSKKRGMVLRELSELTNLSRKELQAKWQELLNTEPPNYSKDSLMRRLAYRVQEIHYGGLPTTCAAQLKEIAAGDNLAQGKSANYKPPAKRGKYDGVSVGTKIIRDWRGQRYTALRVETGYEYDGKVYASLSALATAITGQKLNGRKFFRIKD